MGANITQKKKKIRQSKYLKRLKERAKQRRAERQTKAKAKPTPPPPPA
jgi:hypothetical protein